MTTADARLVIVERGHLEVYSALEYVFADMANVRVLFDRRVTTERRVLGNDDRRGLPRRARLVEEFGPGHCLVRPSPPR